MADNVKKEDSVTKPDEAALSGPVFLAAGEDGSRMFSRDGRAWTHRQIGKEGEIYSTAALGGGRCVVGGRFGGMNVFAATSDGIGWEAGKHDAQYANYIRSIVYFGGRFIGYGSSFLMLSSDGVHWGDLQKLAEFKVSFGIVPTLRRFAVGDGSLAAVGDFGRCSVTKDGVDWTNMPNPKPVNTMIDVAYGNGVFVGGGMHGLRMRSVDGLVWTHRVVGEEGEHINAMIWDGKQFVGIGQGATYFSPDGIAWQRKPNTSAPTMATFGAGVYVGSLWQGRMLASTDGITWQETAKFPQHVLALAYGVLGASPPKTEASSG
jgi:hypothetical protein